MQEQGRRLVRVNIGCGRTPTEGWENFDNSLTLRLASFPRLVKWLRRLRLLDDHQSSFAGFAATRRIGYANATKRIPFEDGGVEILYSSHMLEHLDREEAGAFLGEAKRVLCSGGILRLAVPDLRKQVVAYMADHDADRFIAGTLLCQPRPRTIAEKLRLLLMGTRNHQWMYDGPSLCNLLNKHGFTDSSVLAPGETNIGDPGALDLREREHESVYVEARAP